MSLRRQKPRTSYTVAAPTSPTELKAERRQQFEASLQKEKAMARQRFQKRMRYPPHQRLVGTRAGREWRESEEAHFEEELASWEVGERERFQSGLAAWVQLGKYEVLAHEPVRTTPQFKIYPRMIKETVPTETYTPLLSYVGERGPEYILVRGKDPKEVMLEPMRQVDVKQEIVKAYQVDTGLGETWLIKEIGSVISAERIGVTKPIEVDPETLTFLAKHYPLTLKELYGITIETPKGYEFERITQAERGYEVEFKPLEERKGIAEWLAGITMLKPLSRFAAPKTPQELTVHLRGEPIQVRPLAPIAGYVASFEKPIYTIARLAGLPSPRPPPLFISGVIGEGLEAGLGWPSRELEETMEYGSQYAVGTVLGDILLSLAVGKVWEKAITKPVTMKAEAYLTRKYLEKGPLQWKGLTERFVMRVTRAKPYLAPEVVSLPKHALIKHMPELGLGSYWQYGLTPRTSFLWIEKGFEKTTKYVPTYLAYGTAMVPLATQKIIETAVKPMPSEHLKGFDYTDLLSAPRQIGVEVEKTVLPRTPFIPTLETFKLTGPSITGPLMGLAFTLTPRLAPKTEPLGFTVEAPSMKIEMPTRLEPFEGLLPIETSITKIFESVIETPVSVQKSLEKTVQVQELRLRQIVTTTTVMDMPARQVTQLLGVPTPRRPQKIKRKKKRRRKKKGVAFGLVTLEWPVASAKEFLELMG